MHGKQICECILHAIFDSQLVNNQVCFFAHVCLTSYRVNDSFTALWHAGCTWGKVVVKHGSARSMIRHVYQRPKRCLRLMLTVLEMLKTELHGAFLVLCRPLNDIAHLLHVLHCVHKTLTVRITRCVLCCGSCVFNWVYSMPLQCCIGTLVDTCGASVNLFCNFLFIKQCWLIRVVYTLCYIEMQHYNAIWYLVVS